MTQSTVELKSETLKNWHRLSPVSVIFFLLRLLKVIVKDSLPGLAPLAIVVFNSDDKIWLTSLILGVGGALFVSSAVLQYWFFRYRVNDHSIDIHSGVFKKNQRELRFSRIQNINIIQPVYFKPFSLVTLQLETAGSKSSEGDLVGINRDTAEKFKSLILAHKADTQTEENQTDDTLSDEPRVTRLVDSSLGEIIQYGVTSNGMFWLLVFLAPFMGMLDDIIKKWVGKENFANAVDFFGGGLSGGITLAAVSILGVFAAMLIFSILGAILRFYHYQLRLNNQTLKRHSGLFSTYEESTKLEKVQAFVQQTNFIGHWLKVENVILRQAAAQANQSAARSGLFVIPSQSNEKVNQLFERFYQRANPFIDFKPISRRYIYKSCLMLMLPVCALLVFLIVKLDSPWPLLLALLAPVFWLLLRIRWKKYGYQITPDMACVKSGFIGHRKEAFLLYKVQRVEISQSYFQKRRGLANLNLYLASSRISIPYMQYEDALNWFDAVSQSIEQTDKSWF